MSDTDGKLSSPQPRAAFLAQYGPFWAVGIFGLFVNLLMLTSPIFALQIYDRVLGSRSQETLLALTLLMVFLFIVMGVLDHARKRVAARIGERIVSRLDQNVFHAALASSGAGAERLKYIRDLDAVRQLFASSVFTGLVDLPWVPFFLLGIALFHPVLGWFALFGAVVFMLLGLMNFVLRGTGRAQDSTSFVQASRLAGLVMTDPDTTRIFGLQAPVFDRWLGLQHDARSDAMRIQDRRAVLTTVAQTFRIFLQSAMIALGAYLVVQNELTAGAIFASTVLLARALGPLDLIGQNWLILQSSLRGWRRLSALLAERPPMPATLPMATSGPGLQVEQVTVFAPGARQAALRLISFELLSGQAIGIIGPTGAGKSTLIMAIAGVWPVAGGRIRLGGAPVGQINAKCLAEHVGYLPQDPRFFDGTIGENIARFQSSASSDRVIRAAGLAAAHDMILDLPHGYDTPMGPWTNTLAAGLLQRIGLARSIYHEPDILLLDEPTNNLDADGAAALNEIVHDAKMAGKSVVIATQRPWALQGCDLALILELGLQKNFGPADRVLSGAVQTRPPLRAAGGQVRSS
ncbi:MAG: type I secretion system permease/ATPase [Paracoccaceae bacterium]